MPILPTLRGYELDVESMGCIQLICKRCKVPLVLYRRVRGKQRIVPACCLRCGKVFEIEVRVKR